MEKEPLNKIKNEQSKTYIGQVQADCFCQVNILDRQTNPTILIKIRSSYLLICFTWPLRTHSIDGVLLSNWTRHKRHLRYSFVDSYLELHIEINSENETLRQKRWFWFPIVNFPFICSNISEPHAYGVCYSRLLVPIWISVIRGLLLINKYWTKCSRWLGWRDHFKSFSVVIMTRLTIKEYLSYEWPWLCFPLSWFIIGFIARDTLRGAGTGSFHFTPGFKWWSRCPVFCFLCSAFSAIVCHRHFPFSFDHGIVCPFIYFFWLFFWYLQTFLSFEINYGNNRF